MKRRIRLTEGDLHRIVKASVNRVLKENGIDANNYFSDSTSSWDNFGKNELGKNIGIHVTHIKDKQELMHGLFPPKGNDVSMCYGRGVYMCQPDNKWVLDGGYGNTFVYVDLDKLQRMGIGVKEFPYNRGKLYVAEYVPAECIIKIEDKSKN